MRTANRRYTRQCDKPWCGSHSGGHPEGPHVAALDVTPKPGVVLGWAVVVQHPGEQARAHWLPRTGGVWRELQPLPHPRGRRRNAVVWARTFRDTLNRKLTGV